MEREGKHQVHGVPPTIDTREREPPKSDRIHIVSYCARREGVVAGGQAAAAGA